METLTIKNTKELQSEIQRLRLTEAEQRIAVGERFGSPSAIFKTVKSLFSHKRSKAYGFLHRDVISLVSRFAIPFTLNKTIFKHSNFLVKALVGLISKKAAGFVTESSADNLLLKSKSMFKQLFHKANNPKII